MLLMASAMLYPFVKSLFCCCGIKTSKKTPASSNNNQQSNGDAHEIPLSDEVGAGESQDIEISLEAQKIIYSASEQSTDKQVNSEKSVRFEDAVLSENKEANKDEKSSESLQKSAKEIAALAEGLDRGEDSDESSSSGDTVKEYPRVKIPTFIRMQLKNGKTIIPKEDQQKKQQKEESTVPKDVSKSINGDLATVELQKTDESGNSLRSSPHGRMRIRHRTLSGGSEDGRQKRDSLPQISVSECSQSSPSGTLSAANSERDSLGRQEDDTDQIFSYQSRSQMSLSSFGGRSESVTSVYSAAGGGRYGTVTVTGEVLFSLKYNYKGSVFEVHVKECHNLAPVDVKRNRSDPYVKVYLLPDRTKSGKRKTKVKKHTLNPVFDELLKFHVTFSELEKRVLWLTVWHSDRFGRNDFLGEVVLELEHDSFENGEMKCYPLQERTESFDTPVSYKGDIILALKYVPPDVTSRKPNKKHTGQAKGSLHVLVREARNLMATRSNGTSDPFCKSYLLPDKSKAGKQKTSVFKKTCSPKWNHTFVYDDVTVEDLKERCLELTIWDYDKITSNDFLGGVRLCLGTGKHQGRDVDWMDSSGEEVSLWYTMTERPNTWVDGSLLLRPSMQNRRLP